MDVLGIKRIIECCAAVLMAIILNAACILLYKRIQVRVGRIVVRVGMILGNIVILLVLAGYIITDQILYFPHFDSGAYQNLWKNDKMEALELDTPVGSCAGWMYHASEDSQVTMILFPGNVQTSEEMMGFADSINQVTASPINLIILDYPGYGRSQGIPCEYTLKKMMLSAYDQVMLRSDMQNQKVLLMGYSLGTGIANYVMSEREAQGMILMAPYQNGYDLFNGIIDIFHGPLKLMIPFKMRADKFAEKIEQQPYIIASKDDTVVPYETSQALSEHYPNGSLFKTYTGLGHGDFWQDRQVIQDIVEYMDEFSK